MNDTYIVTTYVVIDDILKAHGYEDDCRATGTAAEILMVGVIAAKYFQNHHERRRVKKLHLPLRMARLCHLPACRGIAPGLFIFAINTYQQPKPSSVASAYQILSIKP